MENLGAGIVALVGEDGADRAVGLELGVAITRVAELHPDAVDEPGVAMPFALEIGATLAEIDVRALEAVGRDGAGGFLLPGMIVRVLVAGHAVAGIESAEAGAQVKTLGDE